MGSLVPVEDGLLAAQAPAGGAACLQPVQGLGSGHGLRRELEGAPQCPLLLGAKDLAFRRDKERRAAAREQVQPLGVETPGDVFRDPHAVSVDGEEGAVLARPEGEGVHPHLPCPGPALPAGVIACALEVGVAGGEVADSVASDDDHAIGRLLDHPVEIFEDFRVGQRGVGEGPAVLGQLRVHLEAPAPEDVPCAEVVLHKFIPPALEKPYVGGDPRQVLRVGGVEDPLVRRSVNAEARGARELGGGGVLRCQKRPEPDARPASGLLDFGGEVPHIWELPSAHRPWGRAALTSGELPSRVDHGEGAVPGVCRELRAELRVLDYPFRTVVAVGVVPVVDSIDGRLGEDGLGAEPARERAGRLVGGSALLRLEGDDRGGLQDAAGELDAASAGTRVEHEGESALTRVPAAERRGAGGDT